MATAVTLPDYIARATWQVEFLDDMFHLVDGDRWTILDSDAGSSVTEDADGVNGVVQLAITTTNNNEGALATSNELFQFQADAAFKVGAYIQYTEANTDDANVAFGFADAFGADLIADNGASVGINSSGALIYKVDGGTVWRCNSENNGTAEDSVSVTTAGGASYQLLEIEGRDVDGSNMEIRYYVDGLQLRDSNNVPIKHTLTFASSTQMDLGVYCKTGAAQSETVNVDFIYWVVNRQ